MVDHRLIPMSPGRPKPPVRSAVIHLPDSVRSMGIYLLAGKGSGKSRLMGRVIAAQDLLKGNPQVILDPNGPTIDNLLDKISRLKGEHQHPLWPRIRYVDMGGKNGSVVTWPLYYQLGQESLYERSQRYLDVVKRLDPNLTSASVEGWNALWEVGTYTGMVLAGLGYQITEARSLLTDIPGWKKKLSQLYEAQPEARPAVKFFTKELLGLVNKRPDLLARRTQSLLNKITVFNLDSSMTAMFGASTQSIDWQQVIEQGETVCLDFRHELDPERRRFKMLWVFQSFLAFIKYRGAGRHTPIGLIVDELTALYNFDAQGDNNIFSADLDELINVLARNYRVWLTLAHQELFQIDEKSSKTLLGMGTKIIGVTSDMDAAQTLARALVPYHPARVKKYEPVYGGFQPHLIDLQPVEWTIPEQEIMAAQLFTQLRPFHFLVKPALSEGDITGVLQPMSIENVDAGLWVDDERVSAIRYLLAQKEGQPIDRLLGEIEKRRGEPVIFQSEVDSTQMQFVPSDAKLKMDIPDDDDLSELRENIENAISP